MNSQDSSQRKILDEDPRTTHLEGNSTPLTTQHEPACVILTLLDILLVISF